MTARLPIVGGDDNGWGDILNVFLQVAHNSDGTLSSTAVGNALPSPIPTTKLGGGTASSSNFLRGDGTWAVPNGGSSNLSSDADVSISSPQNNQALIYNSTASKWTNQAITEADVTNLATDLAAKAPLASPNLTGTPTAPTVTAGTNNTQLATTAFVTTAVTNGTASNATGSTPGLIQLDGDLGNTATTPEVVSTHLSAPLPVNQGGTGQVTNAAAYNALSPMATLGDIEYESGANTAARLPGNTSTQKMFLSQTGTGSASAAPVWTVQSYNGLFGDGSDGTVTLNGTNTYSGFATLSGSTYTLTRDVFATSLTISNGVTLNHQAFRIFCTGTFTNNGTVSYPPNNATSSNGAPHSLTRSISAGGNGGNGGSSATGTTGFGGVTSYGVGSGGAGGAGSSIAGGSTANPALTTPWPWRIPSAAISGSTFESNATILSPAGGMGGSGGGGDGTNSGGGGGGGGNTVIIFAYSAINNGTINCIGGNGFTPTTGNCGGGGGGGGGSILVYTLSAWTAGTTNLSGGSGGSGVGTGAAGSAGGSGSVLNAIVQ